MDDGWMMDDGGERTKLQGNAVGRLLWGEETWEGHGHQNGGVQKSSKEDQLQHEQVASRAW